MKKSIAVMIGTVISAVMFFGTVTFASEGDVKILCLEKSGNIISINATNSLPDDTIVTLTVTRDDETNAIWHYDQKKVLAGETEKFSFIIADEKDGLAGAGKYIVAVQNMNRDRDEEILYYADETTVNVFVDELRKAAKSVKDSNVAYEHLLPLMIEDNAGAIIALGIDYDAFIKESNEVKQDAMNLFYKSNIDKLEDKELADAFSAAFGLAVYNNGDKEKGLGMYALSYGGSPMDEEKYKATISGMEDSYKSVSEFKKELCISYGIVTIADSKIGTVRDALLVFEEETGECTDIINEIDDLSPTKQKTAYEYIVKEVDSSVNTLDKLEAILDEAYDKAVKDSGNKGGSGGGGGASGSSSNRVQSGGGSISVAQGSGIAEEKADEVVNEEIIFGDISSGHWAAEAVLALKDAGIVNGNDSGMYEPERDITREEFTKMLVIACGFNILDGDIAFSDAQDGAWYVPYIRTAVENNIVKGIGDNMFGVGEKITRQDMSVMISRAVKAVDITLNKEREYISFEDENEISEYATEEITELYEAGIVNGKGNNKFEPLGNATRAEAAKIIYEAFKGGI